ncbi:MAG: 50S ribosomal protein L18 [Firmicutes bacterium]|nr:50S ribosomal protein L18 [Bacillota bacterium]
MIKKYDRKTARVKRHYRLRHNLAGTTEQPRLAVFRSNKHIYAQVIDDTVGNTLVASSTMEKTVADGLKSTSNIDAAKAVGADIAKKAKDKGIETVVFDRGGFLFHGRVKALADAAREGGLQF